MSSPKTKKQKTKDEGVSTVLAQAVALRRDLHAHPEPGFEEHETGRRLRAALRAAGVEAEPWACAGTGLVVDIASTGSGAARVVDGAAPPVVKAVALRCDMDALRMTELNGGLPHRSVNEGIAHMCGHDGHMASAVLAAGLIQARADRMPAGTRVRVLFQPAEEGPGGALPMLQEGALEGIDEVYGFHNWPTFPVGSLRVKSGPLMAHVAEFEVVVRGAGCHASQPHAGVDAVLVASSIVVQLHTITSRSVRSSENCVVSVTMFHAGEASNVLPDTATLRGTIRDLDPAVFDKITSRIRAICHGVAAAHGATAALSVEGMYPVVVNHAPQTAVVERVAKGLGMDVSADGLPMLGAEDMAYLLDAAHGGKPGCFYFLGGQEDAVTGLATFVPNPDEAVDLFAAKQTGNVQKRSNCMCHATAYDFNDNILPHAARVYVKVVEARLGCSLFDAGELGALVEPVWA